PGGKETEISEVDVHLRLGQAGHCEAEIEAAAIVGVTLEEDLEPLASELVAQGRKECHRGEVAVAYAPGGLRDLALRPDRLHPAILPGADRQGMAAEFRPVLRRAHGRWRQGQGRRGLGGRGGVGGAGAAGSVGATRSALRFIGAPGGVPGWAPARWARRSGWSC